MPALWLQSASRHGPRLRASWRRRQTRPRLTRHSVIVIRGHTAAPAIQATCTPITPTTTATAMG